MDNMERYNGPELIRLSTTCANKDCDGLVIIEPATTQLYLCPEKPELEHTVSFCTSPDCQTLTLFWLDKYPSLDTIYDFQEVDTEYLTEGTYYDTVEDLYVKSHQPPEIIEETPLTPRQEEYIRKIGAFLQYYTVTAEDFTIGW